MFPFNLITIELRADNAERKAVLETLFDPGQLGDDIRATLKEERVTPPGRTDGCGQVSRRARRSRCG